VLKYIRQSVDPLTTVSVYSNILTSKCHSNQGRVVCVSRWYFCDESRLLGGAPSCSRAPHCLLVTGGKNSLILVLVLATFSALDGLPTLPPFLTYVLGGAVYTSVISFCSARFCSCIVSSAKSVMATILVSLSQSSMCCCFSLFACSRILPHPDNESHCSMWSSVKSRLWRWHMWLAPKWMLVLLPVVLIISCSIALGRRASPVLVGGCSCSAAALLFFVVSSWSLECHFHVVGHLFVAFVHCCGYFHLGHSCSC
jgi:hypothetical protein